MSQVLAVTIPIFLLIAIGYIAARAGQIEPVGVRALGRFVLNFALPALIVRAIASRRMSELADMRYLLVYGAASLTVFALVFGLARFGRRRSQAASAIQAMGASVSNSGFIGYSVAALVIGAPAGVALSFNMIVENVLIIPLALALAESDMRASASLGATIRGTAARLIRNPLIIAILAGGALTVTGSSLPGPLAKAIDMLANAASAVALFAIGGSLVGLRPRGLAGDVSLVVFGKLILAPLAVIVALRFAPGLDPTLARAALIFSAVPMIAVYPLLGQAYGQGELCATALLTAVILSFATISTLLYFI